jgi:hypothetical protein
MDLGEVPAAADSGDSAAECCLLYRVGTRYTAESTPDARNAHPCMIVSACFPVPANFAGILRLLQDNLAGE